MKSDFFQRYTPLVLLAFFLAFFVVMYGRHQAHKTDNNNIRQWLPEDLPAKQIYDRFFRHFGSDEFALVSWEGCTLDDPRVAKYARLLERYRDDNGERLFAEVETGPRMLARLTDKPFELKREEALRRLQGIAIGRDGKSTCVIVKLTEAGDANRRATVEVMRQLATTKLDTDQVDLTASDVHMAGDAVTNAEVDIASQQAIDSLVILSILVAVTCAFFGLRSIGLVFVVFLAALYSSFFPEAAVYWLGGNMNLVLVVMPVLVYVLTLSAGVHLVNYYRDALQDSPAEHAPLVAVEHGWLPCTVAATTTAIGLGSLCVSPIQPVKDFGFYSALGIVGSLVFVFLLLPSLLVARQELPLFRRGLAPNNRGSWLELPAWNAAISRFGSFVVDHKTIMATSCLAVLLFLGWGASYTKTSVRPKRFFDEDSRLLTDYRWLAESSRFGPQVPIELVVRFDNTKNELNTLRQLELVSDLQTDLLTNGADLVASAISAATFAPDLAVDRRVRFTLNKRLAGNRPAFHEVDYYSSHGANPGETGAPNESEVPKVELWRISARIEETEKDYDVITREVADHVNSFLANRQQELARQRDEASAEQEAWEAKAALKLEEFQREFADDPEKLTLARQKFEEEKEFRRKRQAAQLVDLQDDTTGVDVIYTGMVPLFYEAQNELLRGLFNSFMLAFLLIAVVMIGWFRSLRAGLVTMFPNVFPAAVIFGYMGWRGLIVDIGSMMTASVAMGIAVDDTVHYLTWFRRGLQNGLSRREALIDAYRRCAQAMTQTTMIAGLSLLVFVFSSFQPVSQFGLLMFVLLVAALVGDLIFLPALLASGAGKLFEPKPAAPAPHPVEQPVA
ncbi:MAG: MMPL family transporter [Planctomycetales bacterium]|nr:MMPL family transporter [Planctomycetales bacterium]